MEYENELKEESVTLPWYGIPRLFPYLKPYGKLLLAMAVFGVISSLIDSAFPLFNRYALERFVYGKTTEGIVLFGLAYLGAIAVLVLCDYVSMYWCCEVEISVARDLKNAAFSHLQTLSVSYFNRNNVGYVHARVMSDTDKIGGLISWRFMDLVWNGSWLVCMLVMMFVLDARLTLYLIALIPFTVLLVAVFQKRLIPLHRVIREINSRITGLFNEGITGVASIKTLAAERRMEEGFFEETDKMKRMSVRAERYSSVFVSGVVFMGSVTLALVLWRGGILTREGVMRVGTLSVFATYALMIMEPVQFIVETLARLVQVQVNIERLTRLLTTKSDVEDRADVIERYGDTYHKRRENWEALHGDVVFEDVTFRYPDGDENVLEHFNLEVPFGTNVAIVGETGAGKSTLVNLVCRFYEPSGGRVLIDGRDAKDRSQQWLHENIGYVLQTPHLFSGTIRENLRYGRDDATEEEMWESLKLVSADDMVKALPDGLDTKVGEGGSFLSTGEKQLLSFARALLSDPRILVLDEATSSIDTVTEKKVQEAIRTVVKGRTSFVIAHRLSTIVDADLILLVEDGKIVEQGTHRELMQKKGAYYALYTRQFEELAVRKAVE